MTSKIGLDTLLDGLIAEAKQGVADGVNFEKSASLESDSKIATGLRKLANTVKTAELGLTSEICEKFTSEISNG